MNATGLLRRAWELQGIGVKALVYTFEVTIETSPFTHA